MTPVRDPLTTMRRLIVALLLSQLVPAVAFALPSRCFGTVANGRLESSVKLPASGDNFQVYSSLAAALGRTHVHSTVNDIVVDAYAAIAESRPSMQFVYGETGRPSGGRMRPHRTHQNGLSVDFMVPVIDARGRSALLPGHAFNRFGYDVEFDANGRSGGLTLDLEAIAEHLYQLHRAAGANRAGIALVIFDPQYLPGLFATRRGADMKRLPFMKGTPWVRHDEHYHVDFSVACEPLVD